MVGKPQLAQKFIHDMSAQLQKANLHLSEELQRRSSRSPGSPACCFTGEALRLHNSFANKSGQLSPSRRGGSPSRAQQEVYQQLPSWVSEAIRNSFRRTAEGRQEEHGE